MFTVVLPRVPAGRGKVQRGKGAPPEKKSYTD